MDDQVGSSGPGGYATEIGQVILMPLQSKNGGLASNFACVHSFLYSYLCFIKYGRHDFRSPCCVTGDFEISRISSSSAMHLVPSCSSGTDEGISIRAENATVSETSMPQNTQVTKDSDAILILRSSEANR
jgi:hypothetical protein